VPLSLPIAIGGSVVRAIDRVDRYS
jgi:hypothetical protein